jgi:hypothetical protein
MSDLGFSNLGFINITIVYLCFALSSMIAIPINRKLGSRLTLCLSGLTYGIWILGFLLPAYKYEQTVDLSDTSIIAINLTTAMIIGLGAGPLWVSQGAFIAECACQQNKGFYNSIFWGLWQFSNILTWIISG